MDTRITRTQHSHEILYGVFFVLVGTLAFSTKSIWIKLIYQQTSQIDAITIMAMRLAIAVPFYLAVLVFIQRRKFARPVAGRFGNLAVLAFLGYYLSSFLDISGLAFIPAGLERMILYIYPTLVVLMVAKKTNRSLARGEVFALAFTYLGIMLIFLHDFDVNVSGLLDGSLLVFGAAISFSVYTVRSVDEIHRLGSIRFTTYTMLFGAAITSLHYVANHGLTFPAYSNRVYFLAAALALTGTVIPSFLMAEGIRRIGADRSAILGTLGPMATIFLAMVILSESISTIQLIGSATIIFGVFNLVRRNRLPKSSESSMASTQKLDEAETTQQVD